MNMDTQATTTLRAAQLAGELGALDVALAQLLAEQCPQASASALMLAAMCSRQLGAGHVCLDLIEASSLLQELPLLAAISDGGDIDELRESLLASGYCVDAEHDDASSPLLLDGSRLYLRRYWSHERSIANDLAERVARKLDVPSGLKQELDRLFPAIKAAQDWQKIACAVAAGSAFSIITGGPGTGKTTTVIRLLALLQTMQLRDAGGTPLRIRLAAPTGKAAARLNESISKQIADLKVDNEVRALIPAEVSTLHRLLGSRPDSRHFRHDRSNPLHIDVLVIDEASMVDLEMMSAVLAALPASARLILLGDKDQLASVEAGALLGSLCARADAGHYSEQTANWIASVTGCDIQPWVSTDAGDLDQSIVMLRVSHRFNADSGIGRFADAVNRGDAVTAMDALDGRYPDLRWRAGVDPALAVELAIDGDAKSQLAYGALSRRVLAGPGATNIDAWATQLVASLPQFQLLCALREGPCGVAGINAAIIDGLRQRRLVEGQHEWYAGRPVLITRNDYALGLMNGDVGLCLPMPDSDGRIRLRVAFLVAGERGSDARLRLIAPSRLGHVETAYAMTVHKAQGSEFSHCALLLPDRISPALTRELLYTAITRARDQFSLIGSADVIRHALLTPTRRRSGLLS